MQVCYRNSSAIGDRPRFIDLGLRSSMEENPYATSSTRFFARMFTSSDSEG